jgi:nucleotide-binding universal stress UspA family protein
MARSRYGDKLWDHRLGHGGHGRHPETMFDTIIWASDGSVRDDRSLPVVRDLCRRYSSSLRIIHVVERVPAATCAGLDVHGDEERTVAKLKARSTALRRHGISASLHVVRGSLGQTADHIAEIAQAGNAQLIVAGAPGRSAWEGAMLGSVTQRLLAVAPCPVLVIPCTAANRGPRAAHPAQPRVTAQHNRACRRTRLRPPAGARLSQRDAAEADGRRFFRCGARYAAAIFGGAIAPGTCVKIDPPAELGHTGSPRRYRGVPPVISTPST